MVCPQRKKKERGFTLIELLISTGIIGGILTIGLVNYSYANRRQVFRQSMRNILEDLRLAQDKAMSGEKPDGCGGEAPLLGYRVEFSETGYILKAVCQGVEEIDVKTVELNERIKITDGPNWVLFKVLYQGIAFSPGNQDERSLELGGFPQANSYQFEGEIFLRKSGEMFLGEESEG